MITAIDTNVVLDVLTGDARFGPKSRDAIRAAVRDGKLVACDAVFAEIGSVYRSASLAAAAFEGLGIEHVETSMGAALDAGAALRAYRARGGKRERVVADFLIGAHALHHADRLLTRDLKVFATYFPKLNVVDPSA